MPALPSGTITFLFTDIEGSTTRWEHQPEAMGAALARHDALLHATITEHHGHVFKTIGDAFCAAFAGAPDAVAAAITAQRWLGAEAWGEIGRVRVRMALHTGLAEQRDGDYFGPPLNRVARLMSAGHGEQVLLSLATHELVRDALPSGVSVLDLGEHRLKDLIRPERIFQLAGSGLPTSFPPLRTLNARPNNLPLQPTALLGREREVVAAKNQLLQNDVRLLTLTGPGGTGKTRLAMQVAADLIDHARDGVFFVALAPISDPGLVASTIAHVLGLHDLGDRPAVESLKEYLLSRALLLVLDNFEQILAAAPVASELLEASPGLKILVTSRAPLGLRAEHEFPVPPLALPDPKRLPAFQVLSQYAAVALFVERAVAIRPDFSVTNENAPAVAEICVRLDGLPLAIELAAARIRLLPPQAMLTRLEHRLPLLTGGARDLPARQRTLRGAIAWSYDLLDEAEQMLFRRIAIFVGGFTLNAGLQVSGFGGDSSFPETRDSDLDALDSIESLVAKSLLRQTEGPDGEPRFGMLETIREFGLEQLEASGEAEAAQRAHAAYFLALAEEAEPSLLGRDQITWLRRLVQEHENIRAIVEWSRNGQIAAEIGLQIPGRLYWFWALRGFVRDGRNWLQALLALPAATAPTLARARALAGASLFAIYQADYVGAQALNQESTVIFRALGDLSGEALSLARHTSSTLSRGDKLAARDAAKEAVSLARRAVAAGEDGAAWSLAFSLTQFGAAVRALGDDAAALAPIEEGVALARVLGERFVLGLGLTGLARLARKHNDLVRSAALWRESLAVGRDLESRWLIPIAVSGLAGVAVVIGQHERAARLFGAAEGLRDTVGIREIALHRAASDADAEIARAALGDDAYEAAWADGRALSLERAVAYALTDQSEPRDG